VIELTGGGGDELLFTQADVLIDLERYDEAEAVVASLDEPIYETLIRGRIQLAQGDPAAALASFDKGVRQWPNNAGARYLAGMAAYELGDWERAITEMRESMRADRSRSDAAHALARIYYDRKDYADAAKYATVAANRSKDNHEPADFIIATRALTQLGEYEKARKAVEKLADLPGQKPVAAAELAHVARAEAGPQSAVDVITESGLDLDRVENAEALRVLVDNLLALDRGEEALRRVDAALALSADSSELHTARGTVLARLRRNEEAAAAFEAALGLDAENASALAGLATIAGSERDYAKAVELFDRAEAESESSTGAYAYSAAQLSMQLGDEANTEERLRKIVKMHPGHAGARNDLAWLLAERGDDLGTARQLAEDANRLDSSPDILDTLGWVYIKRGEGALAVKVLEDAHRQKPDSASIRYHLGMALALAGDSDRAREMLESALDTEGFDEAEAARGELAKLGS
jgi:tetratricopeptide (TPR) repeat protein